MMNNWIIFGCTLLYILISEYMMKKFVLINYKPNLKNVARIKELYIKSMKTLEEQKEYIKLLSDKEQAFGGFVEKFIFIMLFVMATSAMKLNLSYQIISVALMPVLYVIFVQKVKDIYLYFYNYVSMFNVFLFIIIFIHISPLKIYSYTVGYFTLLLFWLLFGYIQEKIYKFIKGGMNNDRKT
jgi:hypothetical protein